MLSRMHHVDGCQGYILPVHHSVVHGEPEYAAVAQKQSATL